MQAANQNAAPSETSRANGHSSLHDIFVLTDEQILEIEPEAQDVTVSENVAQGDSPAGVFADAARTASHQAGEQAQTAPEQTGQAQTQAAQAGVPLRGKPVLLEPPAWLAETMNDPARGVEARALWDGAQRAEREAASYREVFAKPEEARAAAERARVLDDIDRAYFAGDTSQRAQLAAMMMREDPAAFREMVFEGLRALEVAGHAPRTRSVADALSRTGSALPNVGATLASPAANGASTETGGALREYSGQASPAPTTYSNANGSPNGDAQQQAQLAAYAAFERAANEDLERSVGNAIERTLTKALPSLGSAGGALGVGAQHAAPLQARLVAAIRQDIEKALQGDRQLGEQVAQILAGKRLDNETRAQVVRLIGERAQQLVPGAAKRALSDWTQTTLSSHRAKSARLDAASRADLTPTQAQSASAAGASAKESARSQGERNRVAPRSAPSNSSRLDYRKLSDDQILDL
jgi:hypothetical protein